VRECAGNLSLNSLLTSSLENVQHGVVTDRACVILITDNVGKV